MKLEHYKRLVTTLLATRELLPTITMPGTHNNVFPPHMTHAVAAVMQRCGESEMVDWLITRADELKFPHENREQIVTDIVLKMSELSGPVRARPISTHDVVPQIAPAAQRQQEHDLLRQAYLRHGIDMGNDHRMFIRVDEVDNLKEGTEEQLLRDALVTLQNWRRGDLHYFQKVDAMLTLAGRPTI